MEMRLPPSSSDPSRPHPLPPQIPSRPQSQAIKIRTLLRERGLGAVRVGTVDDMQGQESRVVFISTTLSRPESLPPPQAAAGGGGGGGEALSIGFWQSPKRFCVAITRYAWGRPPGSS
jgi:hypothetical protein